MHYRFVRVHPVTQFVDLCSVANISVFVLVENNWGYYIHGKSVHDHADTDLSRFNRNFQQVTTSPNCARDEKWAGTGSCAWLLVFDWGWDAVLLQTTQRWLESLDWSKIERMGERAPPNSGVSGWHQVEGAKSFVGQVRSNPFSGAPPPPPFHLKVWTGCCSRTFFIPLPFLPPSILGS